MFTKPDGCAVRALDPVKVVKLNLLNGCVRQHTDLQTLTDLKFKTPASVLS